MEEQELGLDRGIGGAFGEIYESCYESVYKYAYLRLLSQTSVGRTESLSDHAGYRNGGRRDPADLW